MTEQERTQIDAMSYEQLQERFTAGVAFDPLLRGAAGDHLAKRLIEFNTYKPAK